MSQLIEFAVFLGVWLSRTPISIILFPEEIQLVLLETLGPSDYLPFAQTCSTYWKGFGPLCRHIITLKGVPFEASTSSLVNQAIDLHPNDNFLNDFLYCRLFKTSPPSLNGDERVYQQDRIATQKAIQKCLQVYKGLSRVHLNNIFKTDLFFSFMTGRNNDLSDLNEACRKFEDRRRQILWRPGSWDVLLRRLLQIDWNWDNLQPQIEPIHAQMFFVRILDHITADPNLFTKVAMKMFRRSKGIIFNSLIIDAFRSGSIDENFLGSALIGRDIFRFWNGLMRSQPDIFYWMVEVALSSDIKASTLRTFFWPPIYRHWEIVRSLLDVNENQSVNLWIIALHLMLENIDKTQ